MYRLAENKLNDFLAALAKAEKLYLPVKDGSSCAASNFAANYKEWSEGTEYADCLNTSRSAKDFFFPQTENLFELTYILLDKKSVTAKEMAAHFGVSPRTIYRWVDALNLAGVPVYTSKGRGGGIFISEKYALDKTVFTDEEKKELLAGVQAVNSLSGVPSTQSAVSKLRSLIGNIPEINVKDKSNWIQIDFEPWS